MQDAADSGLKSGKMLMRFYAGKRGERTLFGKKRMQTLLARMQPGDKDSEIYLAVSEEHLLESGLAEGDFFQAQGYFIVESFAPLEPFAECLGVHERLNPTLMAQHLPFAASGNFNEKDSRFLSKGYSAYINCPWDEKDIGRKIPLATLDKPYTIKSSDVRVYDYNDFLDSKDISTIRIMRGNTPDTMVVRVELTGMRIISRLVKVSANATDKVQADRLFESFAVPDDTMIQQEQAASIALREIPDDLSVDQILYSFSFNSSAEETREQYVWRITIVSEGRKRYQVNLSAIDGSVLDVFSLDEGLGRIKNGYGNDSDGAGFNLEVAAGETHSKARIAT